MYKVTKFELIKFLQSNSVPIQYNSYYDFYIELKTIDKSINATMYVSCYSQDESKITSITYSKLYSLGYACKREYIKFEDFIKIIPKEVAEVFLFNLDLFT